MYSGTDSADPSLNAPNNTLTHTHTLVLMLLRCKEGHHQYHHRPHLFLFFLSLLLTVLCFSLSFFFISLSRPYYYSCFLHFDLQKATKKNPTASLSIVPVGYFSFSSEPYQQFLFLSSPLVNLSGIFTLIFLYLYMLRIYLCVFMFIYVFRQTLEFLNVLLLGLLAFRGKNILGFIRV